MDIQHWLDSIVWEEPAKREPVRRPEKVNQHAFPDDVEFAAFFYPPDNLCGGASSAQAARVANKTWIKKKETRAFSDSSFLERDVNCRKAHAKNTRQDDDRELLPANSSSVSSNPSTGSSSSTKSSQRFKRKRRRKTRPDRYELVKEKPTKTKKTPPGEAGKKKKNPKGRKRARNAVKESNDDVVQRFHATNVLTDRLTLNPQGNLGIFNRGRMSSTAKGKGVPDLAMPSLSFLQKPYSASRHAEAGVGRVGERAKKTKTQVEEEEISAFFAHDRPPLIKQDNNKQSEGNRKSKKAKCSKDPGREHPIGTDRPASVSASSSNIPPSGGKIVQDSSSACFSWSNSGSNEDTSQSPRKKPVLNYRQNETESGSRRVSEGQSNLVHRSGNPQRNSKQSDKSHMQRHAKGTGELPKSSAKGRSNRQRVLVPATPLVTLGKTGGLSPVDKQPLYPDMPAYRLRTSKKDLPSVPPDSTAAPGRKLGEHTKSPLAKQNLLSPYAGENGTLQSSPPSLTRSHNEIFNTVPSRPLLMSEVEDKCCLSAHDIGQPLESESGVYTSAPSAFAYPRVARAINPLCAQSSHFVMQSNREEKAQMSECDVLERREDECGSSEVHALDLDYVGCIAEALEFGDADPFDVLESEDAGVEQTEMDGNHQMEWDDGLQGFWRPHRLH